MKVLIICNNEIAYNPRLLKAADFLSEKGAEITVFNPLMGQTPKQVYLSIIKEKNWKLIENDISKATIFSYTNWFFISVVSKFLKLIYNTFGSKRAFEKLFNKGLIFNRIDTSIKYDFVLINLVDNLPFAARLRKINCKYLIYDSQEYFTGQYQNYDKFSYEWVTKAENLFINQVDILVTTTNVMKEKIQSKYNLFIPSFRVRNVPSKKMLQNLVINSNQVYKECKYLIWQGGRIFLNNNRGVHIIVQAVSKCNSNVKLVLQGFINDNQLTILNDYIKNLNLQDKVILAPAADPYNIVDSIKDYDIGLIGEIPEEENQVLTSSNKLFDYINAGLPVIAPDLPGLNETIKEHNLGITYNAGDVQDLAFKIDMMISNQSLMKEFKENAFRLSKEEFYWENDFDHLWNCMYSLIKVK